MTVQDRRGFLRTAARRGAAFLAGAYLGFPKRRKAKQARLEAIPRERPEDALFRIPPDEDHLYERMHYALPIIREEVLSLPGFFTRVQRNNLRERFLALCQAVAHWESGYSPTAVSTTGASGMFQQDVGSAFDGRKSGLPVFGFGGIMPAGQEAFKDWKTAAERRREYGSALSAFVKENTSYPALLVSSHWCLSPRLSARAGVRALYASLNNLNAFNAALSAREHQQGRVFDEMLGRVLISYNLGSTNYSQLVRQRKYPRTAGEFLNRLVHETRNGGVAYTYQGRKYKISHAKAVEARDYVNGLMHLYKRHLANITQGVRIGT